MLPAVSEARAVAGLVRDGASFSFALATGRPRHRPQAKAGRGSPAHDKCTPSPSSNGQAVSVVPLLAGSKASEWQQRGKRRIHGLPGWQACCSAVALPLHRAASTGDSATVAKLLAAAGESAAGGKPALGSLDDGDPKRWTALHLACAGGHEAIVRMLLMSNACDPSLRNDQGLTCWELAQQLGHSSVVSLRDGGAVQGPS